jgi:hypothetical protein
MRTKIKIKIKIKDTNYKHNASPKIKHELINVE